MINEDKIREACASDKERGFKLLMEHFQQPIYWHIRRLVVAHEGAGCFGRGSARGIDE